MKKHSFSKLLLALFAISCSFYLLVSCKDQSSSTQPELSKQAKKITVENGSLKFVDEAHFMDTWALLRKMKSKKELDNWEKQFSGFTSQRTAFFNLTESDIEKISKTASVEGYEDYATLIPDFDGVSKRLVKQVDGDAYGSLYSQEGYVLIGKDAIKYTRNKITKFKNYKAEDFLRYKKGEFLSNISSSNIIVEPIKSKLKTKEISHAEHCTISYNGGNRRFAADYNVYKCDGANCVITENLFMRFSATAMHEKRSFFGIWSGENATELEREGSINGTTTLNAGPYLNEDTINSETDFPGQDGVAILSVWVRVKGKIGTTPYECICSSF